MHFSTLSQEVERTSLKTVMVGNITCHSSPTSIPLCNSFFLLHVTRVKYCQSLSSMLSLNFSEGLFNPVRTTCKFWMLCYQSFIMIGLTNDNIMKLTNQKVCLKGSAQEVNKKYLSLLWYFNKLNLYCLVLFFRSSAADLNSHGDSWQVTEDEMPTSNIWSLHSVSQWTFC